MINKSNFPIRNGNNTSNIIPQSLAEIKSYSYQQKYNVKRTQDIGKNSQPPAKQFGGKFSLPVSDNQPPIPTTNTTDATNTPPINTVDNTDSNQDAKPKRKRNRNKQLKKYKNTINLLKNENKDIESDLLNPSVIREKLKKQLQSYKNKDYNMPEYEVEKKYLQKDIDKLSTENRRLELELYKRENDLKFSRDQYSSEKMNSMVTEQQLVNLKIEVEKCRIELTYLHKLNDNNGGYGNYNRNGECRKCTTLTKELKICRKHLEDSNTALKEYDNKKDNYDEKHMKLQEELDETLQNNNSLNKKIASTQKHNELLKKTIRDMNSEIITANDKYKKIQQKLVNVNSSIGADNANQYEDEKNDLLIELENANNIISNNNADINSMSDQLQKYKQIADNCKCRSSSLNISQNDLSDDSLGYSDDENKKTNYDFFSLTREQWANSPLKDNIFELCDNQKAVTLGSKKHTHICEIKHTSDIVKLCNSDNLFPAELLACKLNILFDERYQNLKNPELWPKNKNNKKLLKSIIFPDILSSSHPMENSLTVNDIIDIADVAISKVDPSPLSFDDLFIALNKINTLSIFS